MHLKVPFAIWQPFCFSLTHGIPLCSPLLYTTWTSSPYSLGFLLTHWGQVMHICVGKLPIISSDNGLPPGRRQAIIWTNDWILLIGPLGINFSEILIKIHTFSFKTMHLKMSSGKWCPSCLSLNVLTHWGRVTHICVGKLPIISSDNGLAPGWCQAIIWTNDRILLFGPLGISFSEIHTFSFKTMHLKMSSEKWCPSCPSLNVLTH